MLDIQAVEQEILTKIENTADNEALEQIRISCLGKKGSISVMMRTLGQMSEEQRKSVGAELNELKTRITQAINLQKITLKNIEIEQRIKSESVDITLPTRISPASAGRIHPITQVIDEITAIFADMEFEIAEGPEIETDYYNFTALNFPEGHPAREMHDTFFFNQKDDGMQNLLRTHTSTVQIRTIEAKSPPIRIIIPGKTYRCDSDATHSPMFHQLEGLVIDKSATIANLKWTLEEFCKSFFEVEQLNMRLRPSFFPFTEPSLEVDIQCSRSGNHIQFGQGDDWLEILGCGMVHPNVLRGSGLDPDIYQGFAWGIGIDRLAMLKYGMPDLRAFFDADVRWLSHYGFRPFDYPTLLGGLS